MCAERVTARARHAFSFELRERSRVLEFSFEFRGRFGCFYWVLCGGGAMRVKRNAEFSSCELGSYSIYYIMEEVAQEVSCKV